MFANSFIRFFFSVSILIFIHGCAAKRPSGPAPYEDLPPGQNASKVPENDLPFTAPNETKPQAERIALVMGGMGVSSFATIGILKRFREEGVRIDLIVASGWPTVFALGYGSFKSIHDLEWYSMRLQEKDFRQAGKYDGEGRPEKFLSPQISNIFKAGDLRLSRLPVVVSPLNSELGSRPSSSGDWKVPLLETLSMPGFYRDADVENLSNWFNSMVALNAEEARKEGFEKIIIISMYEDFAAALTHTDFGKGGGELRGSVAMALKRSIEKDARGVFGQVSLGADPLDFSLRRRAVQAGYKEAAKLLKLIKK